MRSGQRGVRRFATVRSRLTLLATAVVALMLVVSAVGLVAVQRGLLTKGVDEALRQRADNLQAALAQGAPALPNEGDPQDSFLQLIDSSGRLVASSPDAAALPAAVPPLEPGSREVIRTLRLRAGPDAEFRVLARAIASGPAARTFVVAKNIDDVNESVRILTLTLALAIPVVLLLLAVLIWWLTGRTLRPVESIREEVASIQGTELDRRVHVSGSFDEISRLALTMNAMLDRVELAANRERMFVADASHELRSPLTRIRCDLELGIAHPQAVNPATTFHSLLADVGLLQDLVDDLLFLARSESGSIAAPTTPVDLDDVVLEEARRLRLRGRVRVDTSDLSAARTHGDRSQLARAVRNLGSNAERHARTVVRFELSELDGRSELVVADDGPGIPEHLQAKVFERFARLDEARSRDAGGSGLGLAIVRDIVTRHEGTVTITSSAGEGARFRVSLPRAE